MAATQQSTQPVTPGIPGNRSTEGVHMSDIRICRRCLCPYNWKRSPSSSLKMTYCGTLCEKADLGFTIEALIKDVHRTAWRRDLVLEEELVPA
ncbi:MAG TPA: hypothetical protein VIH05_11145 [Tepidiformaceae bacterium]|jgi:hypothetical protein